MVVWEACNAQQSEFDRFRRTRWGKQMATMSENHWLSERLAAVLPSSFFRPLARPSAPIYIDCADRLAKSADEGSQVSHADSLALIRDVLADHPQVQLADDEGAALTDLRQRAAQLYNKLLEAGWLQERPVSLDERWVLLTPHVCRFPALRSRT